MWKKKKWSLIPLEPSLQRTLNSSILPLCSFLLVALHFVRCLTLQYPSIPLPQRWTGTADISYKKGKLGGRCQKGNFGYNKRKVEKDSHLSFLHPVHPRTTSCCSMMSKSSEEETLVGVGQSSKQDENETTRLEDIYEQIQKDGKRVDEASLGSFLWTLGLGLPLWATVILPLSLMFQTGKALLPSSSSSKTNITSSDNQNKTHEMPSQSDITPFKDRKYDLVLLGATGFTGKLAVQYLVQTYGVSGSKVKWAIAGRSQNRLDDVKALVANETGIDAANQIDTIIVDTNDRTTLPNLVKDTRCVATTAGPFAKYGSNVVEFCAKFGTSYVDITGEKDWSVQMIEKWEGVAQQSGAQIISFCGHDCIPWDLTIAKLQEKLQKECNEDVLKVECYDEISAGGMSGGTLATILMSLDGYKAPQFPSGDPWIRTAAGSKSPYKTVVQMPFVPQIVLNIGALITPYRARKWTAPFIMAMINGQVVKRSNALRSTGNLKMTYCESLLTNDFKTAFVNTAGLVIGMTALLNPITRPLIERALPPGKGPSKKKMERGYLCVHGLATGSRGSQVESAMYFPKDAGYKDTARMVVESGLCLALDRHRLPIPEKQGGFFTPSTGMGDALLERLCKTGTMFRCRIRSKL